MGVYHTTAAVKILKFGSVIMIFDDGVFPREVSL
jgi:hypothetical protein